MEPILTAPKQIFQKFPSFLPCLMVGILIGLVRFWSPSTPLFWALEISLFVLGLTLGHALFLFEPWFGRAADTIGQTLSENPLTEGLPEATPVSGEAPRSLTATSPLRQALILLILPILALFLVSSSRLPLGLGFLFGISCVYFFDILAYFRRQPSPFPAQYFTTAQHAQRHTHTLVLWFSLYMALLVGALLLV